MTHSERLPAANLRRRNHAGAAVGTVPPRLALAGPVPTTVLRATQFFEFSVEDLVDTEIPQRGAAEGAAVRLYMMSDFLEK